MIPLLFSCSVGVDAGAVALIKHPRTGWPDRINPIWVAREKGEADHFARGAGDERFRKITFLRMRAASPIRSLPSGYHLPNNVAPTEGSTEGSTAEAYRRSFGAEGEKADHRKEPGLAKALAS